MKHFIILALLCLCFSANAQLTIARQDTTQMRGGFPPPNIEVFCIPTPDGDIEFDFGTGWVTLPMFKLIQAADAQKLSWTSFYSYDHKRRITGYKLTLSSTTMVDDEPFCAFECVFYILNNGDWYLEYRDMDQHACGYGAFPSSFTIKSLF